MTNFDNFWKFLTNFEKFWQILTNFLKIFDKFWQILTNFDKIYDKKSSIKGPKQRQKHKKTPRKTPPGSPCTPPVRKGATQCVSCCLTRFLRVHTGYTPCLLEDFTKKHRFLTLFFRVFQGVLLEFFQKFLLKFCCFYIGKDGEKNCQKFTKKNFRIVLFLRVMCRCNKKNGKKMIFFRKIFYRQRRRKNVF